MTAVLTVIRRASLPVTPATRELLQTSRRIASHLGSPAVTLILGGDRESAAEVTGLAGDVVRVVSEAVRGPSAAARIVCQAIAEHKPGLVLFSETPWDGEIAALAGARAGLPVLAGCERLALADGSWRVTQGLYGRFDVERAVEPGKPLLLCLRRSFTYDGPPPPDPRPAQVISLSPPAGDAAGGSRPVAEPVARGADDGLSSARVVVAGGRGIKGPEGFARLGELADVLGGAVAASRAAVDAGWVPVEKQIGQTGKTVSPAMYVAVGISGASQHLAGISGSPRLIAINTDDQAPIFSSVADVAVVADWQDLVPALVAELRRRGYPGGSR